MEVEPDGLAFDESSLRVAPIRVEDAYGGQRATLVARLGVARLKVQVNWLAVSLYRRLQALQLADRFGMPVVMWISAAGAFIPAALSLLLTETAPVKLRGTSAVPSVSLESL